MAQQTHRQASTAFAGCKACARLQRRQAKPFITCSASNQPDRKITLQNHLSRRHVFSLCTALGLSLLRYISDSVVVTSNCCRTFTGAACCKACPADHTVASWFRSFKFCSVRGIVGHLLSHDILTYNLRCRTTDAQAEEAIAAQLQSSLGTEANAPSPDEDIFVAVEFSLALPPGFKETAVLPPKPAATRPGFGSFGIFAPPLY